MTALVQLLYCQRVDLGCPIYLCWAKANWSLVSSGLEQDVLIGVTFRVRYLTTSTVFTCLVFFLQDQLIFTITLLSLLYLTGKYGIMACPFHLLLSFAQGECGTKCQLSHPLVFTAYSSWFAST